LYIVSVAEKLLQSLISRHIVVFINHSIEKLYLISLAQILLLSKKGRIPLKRKVKTIVLCANGLNTIE